MSPNDALRIRLTCNPIFFEICNVEGEKIAVADVVDQTSTGTQLGNRLPIKSFGLHAIANVLHFSNPDSSDWGIIADIWGASNLLIIFVFFFIPQANGRSLTAGSICLQRDCRRGSFQVMQRTRRKIEKLSMTNTGRHELIM